MKSVIKANVYICTVYFNGGFMTQGIACVDKQRTASNDFYYIWSQKLELWQQGRLHYKAM